MVKLPVFKKKYFQLSFFSQFYRVAHSAKVNIYGLPFIREMPKITGISGRDLIVKCPVAGYPIDKIHWERGKQFIFLLFVVKRILTPVKL